MENNETIGSRFRDLRKAAGLSQSALAKEMRKRGCSWHQPVVAKTETWSQSTSWSVETDGRRLRLDEAMVFCSIVGADLGDLIPTGGELKKVEPRTSPTQADVLRNIVNGSPATVLLSYLSGLVETDRESI